MSSDTGASFLSAVEVAARSAARGSTPDEIMASLLPAARQLAIAPISGFRVGAVARGVSGALYLGANLEFPGVALNASVHAEQAAVVNAWAHGERGVTAVAASATPCGHCRQFLNEVVTADQLRILVDGEPPATLAELLPSSFGPRDLGLHQTGKASDEGLMSVVSRGAVRTEISLAGEPLRAAALDAANFSYAPYSKTYAGIALELADGSIQPGSYAECAAFNPSLSPLQVALVALALRSTPFAEVRYAVLAETDGPASQRSATEGLLALVAPGVKLDYLRLLEAE